MAITGRNNKDNDKKLVVSSNDLIHAKYTFTLWQKRVFTYMISQINMEDTDFLLQRMYVKELMDFFKVKNKDDYNVIQRIPEQLYEMSMKMPYTSEKGHKRWREIRILSQFTRPEDKEPDNAYVEMKFNDDLKPHLLELKRLFSQYDIRNIIHLRSVYSFKLYELIKSNEYLGKWEISLTDLKEMLDVEDKYKHYGSFKLKILNQAQKDLTECCDVTFTYDEKAIRKRVERLIFYIKKNQPTKNTKKKTEETTLAEEGGGEATPSVDTDIFDQLFSTYYLQLKEYGISASTLTLWLNTYAVAHIEACVKDFLDKAAKGKLRITEKTQQGGYLRRLIEQADFSTKQENEKVKVTRPKQADVTETPFESAKKHQIKTQLAKEAIIIADILTENPDLELEILTFVNQRDGTEYILDDIQKYPFLPSKIGVIVKQRFSERF
jgi:plasmid replication initiation protein